MIVTYHLAQGLTMYGCFQDYLFRRKKVQDPKFNYYLKTIDTVSHTFITLDAELLRDDSKIQVASGLPENANDILYWILLEKT